MYKVMVVDDEQTLREAYSLILSVAGYQVITAYDGVDALEQYNRLSPDVILLDMLMPNLDGLGVLQKLSNANKLNNTKVIVFSNLSTSEKIDKALAMGAQKHLIKSRITPKQLLEQIRDMLSAHTEN